MSSAVAPNNMNVPQESLRGSLAEWITHKHGWMHIGQVRYHIQEGKVTVNDCMIREPGWCVYAGCVVSFDASVYVCEEWNTDKGGWDEVREQVRECWEVV